MWSYTLWSSVAGFLAITLDDLKPYTRHHPQLYRAHVGMGLFTGPMLNHPPHGTNDLMAQRRKDHSIIKVCVPSWKMPNELRRLPFLRRCSSLQTREHSYFSH